MPVTTPEIKIEAVRRRGGQVKLVGETYSETQTYAQVSNTARSNRNRQHTVCLSLKMRQNQLHLWFWGHIALGSFAVTAVLKA